MLVDAAANRPIGTSSLVARRPAAETQIRVLEQGAGVADSSDPSPRERRKLACNLLRTPSVLATAAGAGVLIWFYCVLFAEDFFSSEFWTAPSGTTTPSTALGAATAGSRFANVAAELSAEVTTAAAAAEAELINLLQAAHASLPQGESGKIVNLTIHDIDAVSLSTDVGWFSPHPWVPINLTKGSLNGHGTTLSNGTNTSVGHIHGKTWLPQAVLQLLAALNMTRLPSGGLSQLSKLNLLSALNLSHVSTGSLSHLRGLDLRSVQKWNATHSLANALSQLSRMNVSTDMLRRTAENLRKQGQVLQIQGEEKLRKKQAELMQKGAQVHNASVALADAISSGQVQQNVVVGIVSVFFIAALALQILSALRGNLRQCTREFLTKPFTAQPAPNELVTRSYSGWMELAVRVTLDFLNEPANVMLMSIGSMQVLATWSKADPWKCKKVNLLVLLLNYAYTLVQEVRAQLLAARHDATWNLARCLRVASGVALDAAANDAILCELRSMGAIEVLAKDIEIGDVIRLRFGDICPSTGKIVHTSHSFLLFNSLCETGEDCCSILSVGDTVLRGFVLASEDAVANILITATRNSAHPSPFMLDGPLLSPPKCRRMERFPEHMNKPLTFANLAALSVLFGGGVLVSALNYRSAVPPTHASSQGSLSPAEQLLVTHFFSTVVQLNTLIPSMRWVVLFFMYVFLVEVAQPNVHVRNWRAFHGLEQRLILYSDKTGTLTEVGMHVARLRLVESGANLVTDLPEECASDDRRRGKLTSDTVPWLAAVLMACNDCQPVPQHSGVGIVAGRRPGTSPEEMAIAEHLEHVLGIVISSNPLRPGMTPPVGTPEDSLPMHAQALVLRDNSSGQELVHGQVLARGDFNPAQGCREAKLVLSSNEIWLVRQGGADLMAALAGHTVRENELAAEDRDRALGWCVARVGSDGSRIGAWRYVMRASFRNPPRAAAAPLVAHCTSSGLAVRILTGDAFVAALHIAQEIGVLSQNRSVGNGGRGLCSYEVDEPLQDFVARIQACLLATADAICVAAPGSVVRQLIEANRGLDSWLSNGRISAVIYRTRAADKAFIVQRTETLGRDKNICAGRPLHCIGFKHVETGICIMMGDAANDAEAIGLDTVVGISLRHGAAPCKLNADFVINEPGALITVRTELHSRALAGARWLLEDVCFLCGLVSALTFCGVWAAGFVFLPRGFLYDDPFDARLMTLFSSGFYAPSACAAACGAAAHFGSVERSYPRAIPMLLIGATVGFTLGLAGPSDDLVRFGRWILTSTASVSFLRHASTELTCSTLWWRSIRKSIGVPEMVNDAPEAPNCLAAALAKSRTLWLRCVTLTIYLFLVWL